MLQKILVLHNLMNEKEAGVYSDIIVSHLEEQCKNRGIFANTNGDADVKEKEGKKELTEKDYIKLMLDYFITLEKKEGDSK